ncbi:T9SS C-terminal target domain-containing protein [Mariniphaga sediminis]|uniref:T9SS C-terminal target domain-containing protein n=1 Tax=Mariniphaga sediminis TaxID=1628158 RepID=A0A399CXF8_9BACT|nr:right-handed parallel beta-helix repeat-containing protein [Mariniphaga sediminis]RIH64425.1 T9SS C-terminal target domain-containing protein [Mariniphaga sediminis]
MKLFNYSVIKGVLLIIALSFSTYAFSTVYYISNTGNDANSGLTKQEAWQTLDKVNELSLQPGDKILLKRGDTFYGSIIINQEGNQENPIVVGAYGDGDKPLITGFKKIESWTSLDGNLWESTDSISSLSSCNMVLIDGENTPMGRIPNTDYLTYYAHSEKNQISTYSLSSSVNNWTGADIVIRTNHYVWDRRVITSHVGGTLGFENLMYQLNDGFGFFIQNDIRTVNVQNEWYYNPETGKITVFSASEPSDLKMTTIDYLIVPNGSYIVIEDLALSGANDCGIYNYLSNTAHHITVKNCDINYSGKNGISLRKYFLIIENNKVYNSNVNGIVVKNCKYGSFVRGNDIQNSGLFPGIGDGAEFCGIRAGNHNGLTVENNTIINSGYCGITFRGDSMTVKNNYIEGFCFITDDGGGIYTHSKNLKYGNKIIGNIVTGTSNNANKGTNNTLEYSWTNGIYLDQSSTDYEVAYNTAFECGEKGVFWGNSGRINFHHNTLYNSSVQFQISRGGEECKDNTIKHNIFCAKTTDQKMVKYHSPMEAAGNPIYNAAEIDSNIYARPIDDYAARPLGYNEGILTSQRINGNPENIFRPLSASYAYSWQSYSNKDQNSKMSPQGIDNLSDISILINPSDSVLTVNLEYPVIDIEGEKFSGTLQLDPYTSKIILKDYNATGVLNLNDLKDVKIFPNPCSGKLSIQLSNLKESVSVDIYDLTGKKIISQLINNQLDEMNLDGLDNGVYIVRINQGEKILSLKLIKT